MAAKLWLVTMCCLAAWSLLPFAFGWQSTVVVTGSMEPAVHPGDIVVIDPQARKAKAGQIVVIRDPEVPSGRLMHRVVSVHPDGSLVTKGDANPTVDSTPVAADQIEGIARFVVPAAGRFTMLWHKPASLDIGWALVTVVAGFIVAIPGGRDSRTPYEPERRRVASGERSSALRAERRRSDVDAMV